ncbi:hypothetical protein EB077_11215 [bacterium]|nr:hypothetical protein [bacterium]
MIKVRFNATVNGDDLEIEARASDVNSYFEPLDLRLSVVKDDGTKIKLTSYIENETSEYEMLEDMACEFLYEKKYEGDVFDQIY